MERKKILRFKTKIKEIVPLAPNVKNFVISADNFDFYPGQYVSIILKKGEGDVRRPYSIASKPGSGSLEFCIKIIPGGLITPLLDQLDAGSEVEILGPLGDFTLKEDSMDKDLVFVSSGTGIGPFRSMINYLLKNDFKKKVTLITGYRYEEDTLYEDEFLELEKKHENFSYHRILSKPNSGEGGYVQNLVEKNLDSGANYYICGLKEMINSVKDLLLDKGIPEDNIFFEKYD